MPTYEFSIAINRDSDFLETEDSSRLFDAGMDDTTLRSDKDQAYIDFLREADSPEAAISEARGQIESINLEVVWVSPVVVFAP